MGSDIEEDEKPAHRIAINRFYLGQTEVTQALWRAVMGTNPSYTKNCDACPVESVNWTDIQDFIERLNQLTGKQYRLPTEAEWEYAAGGGASGRTKYAGTNDEGSITNYAWYTGNSSVKTHPVGTKSANALGLFDMSGNVGELCQDWYYFRYYENSPAVDPVNTELGTYYVVRGGGWSATFKQCRVAARGNSLPDNRDKLVGFRLARSPE
jgi:formylglycine-generating enzyme required for sulfatase activity